MTRTTKSAAHTFNMDAAQREMDSRQAQGEDMTGATIDPVTYAIIRHPDVVAAEAAYAAEMAAEFAATELQPERTFGASSVLADEIGNEEPTETEIDESNCDAENNSEYLQQAADKLDAVLTHANFQDGEFGRLEGLERDEPAPFTLSDFDLVGTGRHGGGRIVVKVHGYWSNDIATLYIERKFGWSRTDDEAPSWECSMSHSSGGRDTKEVLDDCEAEANFGAAIIALANIGKSLLTPETVAKLEAHFQARREEDRVEREAEKAAKEAAIAADPELGTAAAKALINLAVATVKAAPVGQWRYNECVVTIGSATRGSEATGKLVVRATRAGVVKIYVGDGALSFEKAVEFMAKQSHRSAIKSIVNPATGQV